MDETRIQCNKEKGKKASSDSFIWVMRSAAYEELQAAFFYYNDLDVYAYLKYLLAEMPNNQHLEHPEIIDQYLPWALELPDECRRKRKNKKCFK